MDTKQEILEMLLSAKGEYVSGNQISEKLGVSRMAVNKAVAVLKRRDYPIEAKKHWGYRLDTEEDIFSSLTLERALEGSGITPFFLEETVSTNRDAKEKVALGVEPPFVVATSRQSGGRGRMGRVFESPKGGVYFSLVLRGDKIASSSMVTVSAAWAIATTMERLTGIECSIKWVNDVYIGKKKAVGILTEGIVDMENGGLSDVVIGCGVNLKSRPEDFSPELREKVTSFYPSGKAMIDRATVVAECSKAIVEAQERPFLDEYRKKCFLLGKKIQVIKMDREIEAEALDIDDQGHLLVKYGDGSREALSSGEVSIRL